MNTQKAIEAFFSRFKDTKHEENTLTLESDRKGLRIKETIQPEEIDFNDVAKHHRTEIMKQYKLFN